MNSNAKIKINGKQIEKVITKYYYKGEKLHFSIILKLRGVAKKMRYNDFDSYSNYKSSFNRLITAKNAGDDLRIPAK